MSYARVVFAMIGLLGAIGAVQAGPVRFKQDRFVISYWVGPPINEKADQYYKEMADAHFTMIHGSFNPETDKLLKLARKYKMPAIVRTPNDQPVEKWTDDPMCWGYHIKDEPNVADFPRLRGIVDEVRKYHPGKLAFINLYPSYASTKQLGTETYEEHVARFVKEVDPDVLCMDYYPRFKHDFEGRDRYCENLDYMRKYSLQQGIPFWNFFNVMPFGPHTDPTEAQIRWQVFASATYGAKGVLYFCYQTPPGGEFSKGGAILAQDGTKTRHYYQAQQVNLQLKNLGPTLMQLTSTGVIHLTGDDTEKTLAGSGIKNIKRQVDVDPPNDYLVGSFKHSDGRRAVMLMNYSYFLSAWPTVEFDCPTDQVRELDKFTGKEIPVRDESPNMPGLQVSLEDGEARLFLLPGK